MRKHFKRVVDWFEDRTGLISYSKHVADHPVPRKSASWAYVFGSATLVVFVLQIITGLALAGMYIPAPDNAYKSLQYIESQAFLGSLVRGMHYIGSSAMVLLVGAHAIRVFMTGSYKFPRELGWMTGIILLVLTIGTAFTGQLLRWDSNGVWTVIVAAEQAGRLPYIGDAVAQFILAGQTVGGATLSRFFSIHAWLLPGGIIGLLGLHLYLVLRNGISEPPEIDKPVDPETYRQEYKELLDKDGRPFWPDAAWRDLVFGSLVIGTIVLLAWVIGAPHVSTPPDPAELNVNPRPDWYLMWYFGVLSLIPSQIENYVIVGAPLIGLGILFIFPIFFHKGHRHPRKRPWAALTIVGILAAVAVLTIEGERSPWSPDFSVKPLTAATIRDVSPSAQAGAVLFYEKGCEYCHQIDRQGGHRGPDLSHIGDLLSKDELTIRIMNGGHNMPSFAGSMTGKQLEQIVAFLQTRKAPAPKILK